ncbi:hypothetical protein K439DRAFT_1612703 [Ramaria rubella]|nr:hypothetical protein K439DRAFT_1612703 [Ramaria rubella]
MPLLRSSVEFKEREPAWKRFFKALAVAVIIYGLCVMLIKGLIGVAQKHGIEGVPDGPLASDGHVVQCSNDAWNLDLDQREQSPTMFTSIPPYSSSMSFIIPVSSNLIFLMSRGSYDYGSSIKLEISDNPRDDVEIEVVMSYYSNAARNRAQVCLLERDEGAKGVGFFTPRRYYPDSPRLEDRIKFTTTVRLPRPNSLKNPLLINAFETNMGIWAHHITSLEDSVIFKSLSLHASNSKIHADSVSAISARLATSNSAIGGSYNISHSLVLSTSNSPINADIRMENRDGHTPTELELKTSNSRIRTSITLVSTDNSVSFPPSFSVSAKTSNGPLDVTFPDAPSSPFSHLEFTGKTSNSPANIKLHATYEGSISLSTSSHSESSLLSQRNSQDPSGKGRHRTVDIRKMVKGALDAGVWWGDDSNKGEGKGKVVVKTSNAKNTVDLA